MGLFDEIAGKLSQTLGGGATGSSNLVQGVLSVLSDARHGGLNGLVQNFQNNGLGDIIGSWIGTGPNKSIAPEQLANALGNDRLQQLSQATGLPLESLGSHLSSVLPALIDKLTPGGNLPQGSLLEHAASLLKGKL